MTRHYSNLRFTANETDNAVIASNRDNIVEINNIENESTELVNIEKISVTIELFPRYDDAIAFVESNVPPDDSSRNDPDVRTSTTSFLDTRSVENETIHSELLRAFEQAVASDNYVRRRFDRRRKMSRSFNASRPTRTIFRQTINLLLNIESTMTLDKVHVDAMRSSVLRHFGSR